MSGGLRYGKGRHLPMGVHVAEEKQAVPTLSRKGGAGDEVRGDLARRLNRAGSSDPAAMRPDLGMKIWGREVILNCDQKGKLLMLGVVRPCFGRTRTSLPHYRITSGVKALRDG